MAQRPGFVIPNATDVGVDLDQAEPDALDFNLLGNHRYGVIDGCAITVSGSSWVVNRAPGTYVVDGALAKGGGQITLPTASQDLRFDLIVGDAAGGLSAIIGTADPNPSFPQFDDTVTVFAAILVVPGATPPQADDVIDKRLMLKQRFVTAVDSGVVLESADTTSLANKFAIDHDGKVRWGNDTTLERVGAGALRITQHLDVTGTLTADDMALDGGLDVVGVVTADNFRAGITNPTGTAPPGTLYRNLTTGALWVFEGTWQQLSTTPIPPGFTMPAFTTTAPAGWLLVNGQTVTQTEAGGLWTAFPSWRIDATHLRLPDARDCFFAWGNPGIKGGNPSPQVSIGVPNLPPHKHLTTPTTGGGGSHSHTASMTTDGAHAHTTLGLQGAHVHGLNDPGHVHPPYPDSSGGPPAIPIRVFAAPSGFALGNQPIILAPSTGAAVTGLTVTTAGSNHAHSTDTQGSHVHGITVNPFNSNHVHGITEVSVGGGVPIDIRPPFMGLFLYIKT